MFLLIVRLPACLTVCSSVHPSTVRPSVRPSVCPLVCLSSRIACHVSQRIHLTELKQYIRKANRQDIMCGVYIRRCIPISIGLSFLFLSPFSSLLPSCLFSSLSSSLLSSLFSPRRSPLSPLLSPLSLSLSLSVSLSLHLSACLRFCLCLCLCLSPFFFSLIASLSTRVGRVSRMVRCSKISKPHSESWANDAETRAAGSRKQMQNRRVPIQPNHSPASHSDDIAAAPAAPAAAAAATSFAVAADPPAAQPLPSPASAQRRAELPSYLGPAVCHQHLLVGFKRFKVCRPINVLP